MVFVAATENVLRHSGSILLRLVGLLSAQRFITRFA